MPHFYFDLRTPEGRQHDDIGLALADVETAYLEAYRAVPGVAAELMRDGADPFLNHSFEIRDAQNRLLIEVPFWEALEQR